MVEMDEIIFDPRHQPRTALEPWLVERYANFMKTGSRFPPVTVGRIKGKEGLHLLCGWHRCEAAARLGANHVQAIIVDTTFNKALWIAAADNLTNGQAYRKRDNKRVFSAYIKAKQHIKPDGSLQSYRDIEKATGVGFSTAHNWMKKLFPSVFQAMGKPLPGFAGAPGGPAQPRDYEAYSLADKAVRDLELLSDDLCPEQRYEIVARALAAVRRIKRKPRQKPDF